MTITIKYRDNTRRIAGPVRERYPEHLVDDMCGDAAYFTEGEIADLQARHDSLRGMFGRMLELALEAGTIDAAGLGHILGPSVEDLEIVRS